MKKLLETLYILTPDSYVYHRNENICIRVGDEEKKPINKTRIESIVFFGKNTISTSLIRFCGENHITMTFLDPYGHFLGRAIGGVTGNVLLRKRQYDSLNDNEFSMQVVRDILYGKIANSKNVMMRAARTAKNEKTADRLYQGTVLLSNAAQQLDSCQSIDAMRGVEGAAAAVYFGRFDDMLNDPHGMKFESRSHHPPLNEVNCVLSFLYMQLEHMVCAALESVGLDPAAGYLHTLRPGRESFALDLMEELRAPLCDRLTLTLFNRGQLSEKDFDVDSNRVYMTDKGRKKLLEAWRRRCIEDEITHPFLNEKIQIGLIPYTQAMLFARVLRGDLDRYPPFDWR